jgi:hypothetical protein
MFSLPVDKNDFKIKNTSRHFKNLYKMCKIYENLVFSKNISM